VEVIPQNAIRNLQGRSVRLDLLCKKNNGSFCTVEVQKADDDNHIKRIRYNTACITANVTAPGTRFENVPDVYAIFISTFDIFESGKTNKVVEFNDII
jgi:predicted transposase/invertase (TIGR01784 family)